MARKPICLPLAVAQALSFYLLAPAVVYPGAVPLPDAPAAAGARVSGPPKQTAGPSDSGEFLSTEPAGSNIRELIPARFKKRYLRWKNDYLSTEVGREQWRRYARDPGLSLTVTISTRQAEGALVDQFRWDREGRLVAATVTLGSKLDRGYPSSINYPITCSLAPGNLPPEVKGTVLAATKLAHEFGHINQISNMDGRLYELQNRLMLEYNNIFNGNGHDTEDPRLLDLAERMRGTPVSIARDRESWAEVGAILFLRERLGGGKDLKMPQPVREAIKVYFLTYPERDFGEPSPRQ
jgi:hypothetical protein